MIAVNDSHRLVPWADVLYAADLKWWRARNGAPGFAGLKASGGIGVADAFPSVHQVRIPKADGYYVRAIVTEPPGHIGSGGNSGFQAINLAILFGARRILLLGFDMSVDRGTHWHGDHVGILRNPDPVRIARWGEVLDGQAERIAGLGVEIVNCSPRSALQAYPKLSVTEALERWSTS